MKDKTTVPLPTNPGSKPGKAPKQDATLSVADLDTVSGGINPQPVPPGKTRASQ